MTETLCERLKEVICRNCPYGQERMDAIREKVERICQEEQDKIKAVEECMAYRMFKQPCRNMDCLLRTYCPLTLKGSIASHI